MPEALISRITSRGPGVGSGNSLSSSLRSPRNTTPFMLLLLRGAMFGVLARLCLMQPAVHEHVDTPHPLRLPSARSEQSITAGFFDRRNGVQGSSCAATIL